MAGTKAKASGFLNGGKPKGLAAAKGSKSAGKSGGKKK